MDIQEWTSKAGQQYAVRLGIWTNWSRGNVMGATLTLTRSNASLLIAFTSFFIGLVGARSWKLIALAFHQAYSTPEHRDALHHQRQAILRNSQSSESTLASLIHLCWAWRHLAKSRMSRTIPAILLATLTMCSFIVAGGFSSTISSSIGDEVLVDGSSCALISSPRNISEVYSISLPKQATEILNAANYAQQCYTTSGSGTFDCKAFVVPRLPTKADYKAGCPFQPGICRSNESNIILDTGYLDSHLHLGLNAPEQERFSMRTRLHCAPLITEGYKSSYQTSEGNFTRYHYGSFEANYPGTNITYEVDSLSMQYPENAKLQSQNHFNLFTGSCYVTNGTVDDSSPFKPIHQLRRSDGDLFFVFLKGNGVKFLQPSYDLWYQATTPGQIITDVVYDGEQHYYTMDEAASPMACVKQFQICRGGAQEPPSCPPLASLTDAMTSSALLFNITPDAMQNNNVTIETARPASQYIWIAMIQWLASYDPNNVMDTLGPTSLVSQLTGSNGIQGPISDTQWQLDISNNWNTSLASTQAAFVNTAYGTKVPELEQYLIHPANAYQSYMCSNQKILSSMHTSFSLFGLYFVYIAGVLIIIASFAIEPFLAYLQRRRKYKTYAYLEWTAYETLQLQRLAYEGVSPGKWSGCTNYVPIINPNVPMVPLDVSSPNHPRLSNRNAMEKVDGSMTRKSETALSTPVSPALGKFESAESNA
ncbi:hypothetical protein GQ53DRAFT_815545 [Thozetella sp. PMI_491]|nr:hypothetical protein GQ53DRAFT_815545 [Thozetella sp. PMI_491]